MFFDVSSELVSSFPMPPAELHETIQDFKRVYTVLQENGLNKALAQYLWEKLVEREQYIVLSLCFLHLLSTFFLNNIATLSIPAVYSLLFAEVTN